jgi:hypothetical protein
MADFDNNDPIGKFYKKNTVEGFDLEPSIKLNEDIRKNIEASKKERENTGPLDGDNNRRNRLKLLKTLETPKKGGTKRNKKSVRRLVKKRTAKRRKSRRVKH